MTTMHPTPKAIVRQMDDLPPADREDVRRLIEAKAMQARRRAPMVAALSAVADMPDDDDVVEAVRSLADLRQRIEDAVERLVGLLDAADGDPDAEEDDPAEDNADGEAPETEDEHGGAWDVGASFPQPPALDVTPSEQATMRAVLRRIRAEQKALAS